MRASGARKFFFRSGMPPNSSREHISSLFYPCVAAVFSCSIWFALLSRFNWHWWFLAFSVVLLFLVTEYWQQLTLLARGGVVGVFLSTSLFFGHDVWKAAKLNWVEPREWDFQAFWVWGQIAARHLSVYNPRSYDVLASSFHPSEPFRDIVFRGCPYPPPTILLFLTLGHLDMRPALLVWYLVQAVALVVAMLFAWQLFLRDHGWPGLGLLCALVLTLPPTSATVAHAQTNFLVLLWVVLFMYDSENWRGGVWLALGIMTKPLLAILFLYPLVRRNWRSIWTLAISSILFFVLAWLVLSSATIHDFVRLGGTVKQPFSAYIEPINQSLLATILRLTNAAGLESSPIKNPLFLALGGVLCVATAWLLLASRRQTDLAECGVTLTLSFALLLYPATLAHYAVLILVSILFFWRCRTRLAGGILAVAAYAAVQYALLQRGGNAVFIAYLLQWCALAWFLMVQIRRRSLDDLASTASA